MNRTALVLAALTIAGCKSDRDLFDQVKTDTWPQAPSNVVDILWVIDNSASMAEEQTTLGDGFASFAAEIDTSGTDFHLGVITTSFESDDPDRAALIGDPTFLTNQDDYEALFPQRALVGIEGADKEKGLEAAVYALQPVMNTPGAPNEGFVRPEAQLLVVVVSDEEDCSDQGVLDGRPPEDCYQEIDQLPPVSGFVTSLRDLKKDPNTVQVAAIVAGKHPSCADVYPGSRYIAAASLTGGLVGDICLPKWDTMLGDLGLNATGIRTRFQLTSAAKPETLDVKVDGNPVPGSDTDGWTYDVPTWMLEFHGSAVPPRGSEISATYTVQPGVIAPSTGTSSTSGGS